MQGGELDRGDLVTAIRHIKEVTGCIEVVVGGRGALVAFADSESGLLATLDFDVGILVEGVSTGIHSFAERLGRGSQFAEEHGFYIEHAGEEILTDYLPSGWRERACRMEVDGVIAYCLAPVDVAINKLNARRAKDIEHVAALISAKLVGDDELEKAISNLPYAFMMNECRQALADAVAVVNGSRD